MPRQPKPYQSDLFADPDDAQRAQSQIWQALPAETRCVLTQLMVRLVLDHADRNRNTEQGDVRHDV